MQALGEFELRQLLLAGVLISGTITCARCLVTILTDGQGKNGSTVAVSIVTATELLLIKVLLGYQHTVTIAPSGCHIIQHNILFLLVRI